MLNPQMTNLNDVNDPAVLRRVIFDLVAVCDSSTDQCGNTISLADIVDFDGFDYYIPSSRLVKRAMAECSACKN